MKTFKSSSFMRTFKSSRKLAIIQAVTFLNTVEGLECGNRFTWRADDGSGFTIAITGNKRAAFSQQWNASRS